MEVAEHEEIRREEEDCEEKPAVVEVVVGVEGCGEEGGFFEAQEDWRSGEHVRYTWVGLVWFFVVGLMGLLR